MNNNNNNANNTHVQAVKNQEKSQTMTSKLSFVHEYLGPLIPDNLLFFTVFYELHPSMS